MSLTFSPYFLFLPTAAALTLAPFAGGRLFALAFILTALMLVWRGPFAWAQLARAPAAWGLAAFLGWAGLSLLWTLDPDAWKEWLTIAALASLLVLSLRARPLDASRLARGLWIALALAAALIFIEAVTRGALHNGLYGWGLRSNPWWQPNLNHPVTAVNVLVWPALALAWPRLPRFARPLLLLVPLWSLGLPTDGFVTTPRYAPLLGIAAALAAFIAPRLVGYAMGLAMAAWVLLAPLWALYADAWVQGAAFEGLRYSFFHRLETWEFAAQRIAEHPLTGWGLNAARLVPGADAPLPGGGVAMGLHPHNAALQIWLELGAVGALLAAAAVLWLARAIVRAPERHHVAFGLGLLATAFVIAHLSFGIWQTWWLSLLALGALMTAWSRH